MPAWQLNWQLPNNDTHAIALKNQILHQLDDTDVRTDELSFAIKVPFSEAAAQVVIQQNGSPESFDIYQRASHSTTNDQYVLVAKSQPLTQLTESIRQLSLAYYERLTTPLPADLPVDDKPIEQLKRLVHECPACLSRYDAQHGEPHRGIAPGTAFAQLSTAYTCGVCDSDKVTFTEKWLT